MRHYQPFPFFTKERLMSSALRSGADAPERDGNTFLPSPDYDAREGWRCPTTTLLTLPDANRKYGEASERQPLLYWRQPRLSARSYGNFVVSAGFSGWGIGGLWVDGYTSARRLEVLLALCPLKADIVSRDFSYHERSKLEHGGSGNQPSGD